MCVGSPRGYSKEGSSVRAMDVLGRLEVPIVQPISLVGKTGVPICKDFCSALGTRLQCD